jgi:hypothetical protein
MVREAVSAGYYSPPGLAEGRKHPRVQILTIQDLLDGKTVDMPYQYGTFKQAGRVEKGDGPKTLNMFDE